MDTDRRAQLIYLIVITAALGAAFAGLALALALVA
jgi:hypothetical protein